MMRGHWRPGSMAAALAAVLLILVLLLNVISLFLAGRGGLLRQHAER